MRLFLCIAVVLATAAGAAAAVAHHQHPARTGPLELLAKVNKTVTIKGPALTGLYPGASKPFVVTIKNLNTFTIKVAPVKATVAAKTSIPGCTGSANVTVTPWTKALKIAKGKSATATLTVSMVTSPPDACQGAKFSLKISAKAVKG